MTERYRGEAHAEQQRSAAPITESERTPERAEFWTPEQLEKRHRIATLAVQMEKAMLGSGEDRMRFNEALHAAPLAEKTQRAFHNVAIGYATMCANAKDREARLREDLTDDADFGARLFGDRLGKKPLGKVTAARQEGYFVIAFERQDDYFAFRKVAPTASHGSFHRAIELNYVGGPPFPAILLNVEKNPWAKAQVIAHERQHWVNDYALSGFGWSERNAKPHELHTNPKDEVLAYFRDGSSGGTIARALLQSELYTHLFQKDTAQKIAVIERIAKVIDSAGTALPHEARATLTAQLYDIPFEEIPSTLEVLARYYSERHAIACPSLHEYLAVRDRAHDLSFHVLPRALSDAQQKLREQCTRMHEVHTDALTAVYGTDGTFVSAEELALRGATYEKTMREGLDTLHEIAMRLAPDGTPLPTVSLPTYVTGEHRTRSARIAQEMIDVACTIPQADIDRAIDEAETHRVDHRIDTLTKDFASMLSRHTGMRYHISATSTQEGLMLHVQQEANDRMPATTYVVSLQRTPHERTKKAA